MNGLRREEIESHPNLAVPVKLRLRSSFAGLYPQNEKKFSGLTEFLFMATESSTILYAETNYVLQKETLRSATTIVKEN